MQIDKQRQQLRQAMRQRRSALTPHEQQHLAETLTQHLIRHPLYRNSQRIACYLPNDGEMDLSPLIECIWGHRKTCYLPVLGLRHSNRLWFVPYNEHDALQTNRFGIPEPVHPRGMRQLKPREIDLVLMPLVAFDLHGNRLGMGGGFYDRTLSFLNQQAHWRRPRLLGIAYDFQHTPTLPCQTWDIPLDGIATETGIRILR